MAVRASCDALQRPRRRPERFVYTPTLFSERSRVFIWLILYTCANSDWDVYSADPKYSSELSLTRAGRQCFKRRMGPTEVSYYLGSRGEGVESGVNDM